MRRLAIQATTILFLTVAVWPLATSQRPRVGLDSDEVTIVSKPYRPALQFESHADEVQVDVRVLDSRRNSATGLTKQNFKVEDNGQTQAITGFEAIERDGAAVSRPQGQGAPGAGGAPACAPLKAPHPVLLYFDDLHTEANDLAWSRGKALEFLEQSQCGGQLPQGETVGVVTGSGFGNMAPTSDEGALRRDMRGIAPHPHSSAGAFCPLITPYQAWEIIHLPPGSDAQRLAVLQGQKCKACGNPRDCQTFVRIRAEEVWGEEEIETQTTLALLEESIVALARQPGRGTLVLTSSGFLTQQANLEQAQQALINAALRAHVVIDALDARGLVAPAIPAGGQSNDPFVSYQVNAWRTSEDAGGFSARDAAMWEIAESTGGDFLHDNNDLRSAYERDIAGPEVFYQLTFSRPGLKPDGAFHHLKVAVMAPGRYDVEARDGYFAPTPEEATPDAAAQQKLIHEVLGTEARGSIDAALRAELTPVGLHARLQLNPNSLAWTHSGGRNLDHLTLVFALLRPDGRYVSGSKAEMALRLKGKSLQEISRPGVGLSAGADLAAAPGVYRLRVVALEPSTGAMAAFTENVAIRSR